MAIYPPLHKLLLQLLVVVILDLQFLSRGCVFILLLASQYACNDINFFVSFKEVSLEATQSTL
jgi:hypothetical protein